MIKKKALALAKLQIQERCQNSILSSLQEMQHNERMYFVQKNSKFFEFIDGDDSQITCTIDFEKITLSHQMNLALNLTKYVDRFHGGKAFWLNNDFKKKN